MYALSTQSVGRRRILVVAAGVALLLAAAPAQAADNKGLLHRIGKVEECVFGAQHKDKPLHQRISELEAQTAGGEQNGPLAKRMEALEKSITGDASTNTAVTATAAKSGTTRKASAPRGKRSTAESHPKSTTKTAVTPVPTTTSDYMPPIAPQLDPSAVTPAAVAKKEEAKPEIDEMLRHGTAAFQAGNTDEAERNFREVLAKSPFNSNASFNLGAIAEQKGDLAAALGNYRTALIGSPNDSQIREAITQIETQIAQKQDSPFHNPIASTTDGAPLLKGSATDYTLQANGGYGQVMPIVGTAPAVPPLSSVPQQVPVPAARRGVWQQAAVAGLSIGGSVARTAIRSGISGGGGGSIGSALLQTGLRTGIRAGLGSFGGFLGPLHCPICRIIP